MKKSFLFLSFIVLLIIVAVYTNPDQEKHREVMKAKANIAMRNSSAYQTANPHGQELGMLLGGFFIDNIINQVITADNYVLFSTTKVSMDGETRVIGIGIFGNVFVTKEIDDFLQDAFSTSTEFNF